MNSSWKTYGIVALVCFVLFLILSLFIKALPYLLLAGAVIWLITWIKGGFTKNKNKNNYKEEEVYKANNEENSFIEEDTEVIDVDYKDVK